MGSEGYLINQFLAARTNDRTDQWGGIDRPTGCASRSRSSAAAASSSAPTSRSSTGSRCSTWSRTARPGTRSSSSPTGSRRPASPCSTPASAGTRRGCRRSSPRCRAAPGARPPPGSRPRSSVPVCASNRINTPELAEEILDAGEADLVSMARPLLADPDFLNKAAAGRADEINTCIACNQACLDHVFKNKKASCLVNPRACRETTLVLGTDPSYGVGRRRRRRPGRARRRGLGGRARLRGHPLREGRRDRRPVPAGDAGARQGGLRRDAALLHPPARGARRRGAARHRGHRRRPRRRSTR